MKTLIEFKKERDLGTIITDTFSFIRNEFKPFFKLIWQLVAPYLITLFAAFGFLLYTVGDLTKFATNTSTFNSEESSIILLFISILILIIAGLAAYVLAHAATLYYIKSYINNQGNVDIALVKDNVKNNFFSFLGLGFLNGIVVMVAALLCFFPLIYVVVPMSVIYCLKVYQDKPAMDAFSDSFKFTWNDWGMTFLTIFVVALIVGVIGAVLNIPATIYSIIKMGIFSGNFDQEGTSQFDIYQDPVYIILNLIGYAFKYFLNFISIITTVFIYFNINEKRNFTGTIERIQSIGETH